MSTTLESTITIDRKPFEAEMHDVMGGRGRWEVKVHDHGLVALLDVMPRLAPVGKLRILRLCRQHGSATEKARAR